MKLITTATKAYNAYGAAASLVNSVKSIFGVKDKASTPASKNGSFISQMRAKGVARRNMFDVFIPAPEILQGQDKSLNIHLYAESINLPGVNFATSDIRRYGYGAVEKKPYAPTFNDVNVSLIADGRGDIHSFFYKWMKGIINFDDKVPSSEVGNSAGLAPFEINFKDKYRVDLTITTFNEQNEQILVVKLYGAYPTALADIPLNWGDIDQMMSLNVTFSYFNMQIENIDANFNASDMKKSPISALEKILKVGSAIQVLGALKKPTSIGDVVNVVNNAKIAIKGLGIGGP